MSRPLNLAILLFALLSGGYAMAAQDPLCDVGLLDQMNQRGRLHTQLDTASAKNLIYKPDSVLEYTCFDKFVTMVNDKAPYYMNREYNETVVQPGLRDYLSANFGHSYLGGRTPAESAPAETASTDYTCDAMGKVWQTARCLNYGMLSPQDDFFDLASFIGAEDIRKLPSPACTAPDGAQFGIVPIKGTAISTLGSVAGGPAPRPDTTSGGSGGGSSGGSGVDCGTPIPTGNRVTIPSTQAGDTRPETYNEKICPNPACNYVPTSEDSGTCVAD